MSAVLKAPADLVSSLVEDVHYGADPSRIRLEPEEVLAYSSNLVGDLADALCELPSKRLERLLPQVMGDISADKLVELRDVLRELLIDINSNKASREVKARLERDSR
jgi:hypothetical protein